MSPRNGRTKDNWRIKKWPCDSFSQPCRQGGLGWWLHNIRGLLADWGGPLLLYGGYIVELRGFCKLEPTQAGDAGFQFPKCHFYPDPVFLCHVESIVALHQGQDMGSVRAIRAGRCTPVLQYPASICGTVQGPEDLGITDWPRPLCLSASDHAVMVTSHLQSVWDIIPKDNRIKVSEYWKGLNPWLREKVQLWHLCCVNIHVLNRNDL